MTKLYNKHTKRHAKTRKNYFELKVKTVKGAIYSLNHKCKTLKEIKNYLESMRHEKRYLEIYWKEPAYREWNFYLAEDGSFDPT